MGILRSERMKHGTLVVPVERARHFLNEVGKTCNMQFEDMNAQSMRRPYRKYVQRLDEMDRIVRFLTDEISKIPGADVKINELDNFLANEEAYKMDDVEAELKKLYAQFKSFSVNNAELTEAKNAAIEEKEVTDVATQSLRNVMGSTSAGGDTMKVGLLDGEAGGAAGAGLSFTNIAGVVLAGDQERFARTIFRASRGNAYTHLAPVTSPIIDPKTGKEVMKSVFVIYFQDSKSSGAMSDKVKKICIAYGVNLYAWPSTQVEAEKKLDFLRKNLQERQKALDAYTSFLSAEAEGLLAVPRGGGNSLIEEWRLFTMKEKATYATLNMFEGDITLRADCWYVESEEPALRQTLQAATGANQAAAMLVTDKYPTRKEPPTYIRRNEFTAVAQDLIDTYGNPRYMEANPGLFTTTTFPFIFGMMYGDIGHGTMLGCVAIYLILNAESIKYKLPAAYDARYMLAMMSFFAVYAGFLYNDMFSVGINLFGTRWTSTEKGQMIYFSPEYDITNSGGKGPYPFGIDPAWHGAQNELLYVNSLKMKLSVLMGVSQMVLGVFLRFSNSIHENNFLDLFFECVPMLIFMVCFFCYMDFMIIYKWIYGGETSIINSLICMAMNQKDVQPLFDGAAEVAQKLMLLCVLSVPLMLFPKPIVLWAQNKNKGDHAPLADEEHGGSGGGGGHGHGHGEEFKLDEVIIHQVIETIEYVLGTVSHTASYLRIWALSLAHQQLSLVFFQKSLTPALMVAFPMNGIAIYCGFAVWFAITCGVLLGMDVLECFLHTLRLHWVEFQSKFFKGDGWPFEPFKFSKILAPTGDN